MVTMTAATRSGLLASRSLIFAIASFRPVLYVISKTKRAVLAMSCAVRSAMNFEADFDIPLMIPSSRPVLRVEPHHQGNLPLVLCCRFLASVNVSEKN